MIKKLHNNCKTTHIIVMENSIVFSFFALTLIFFFPFYADIYVMFKNGKVDFSVYLFSFLKLVGGYVTFYKDAYCIHISQKRAFYIKYSDMGEESKKFEIADGFQLYKFHSIIELNKNSEYSIIAGIIIKPAFDILSETYSFDKKFLSLKCGVLLSDNCSSSAFCIGEIFNLFVVTRAIVKIITGRIITIWQKKQKTLKI